MSSGLTTDGWRHEVGFLLSLPLRGAHILGVKATAALTDFLILSGTVAAVRALMLDSGLLRGVDVSQSHLTVIPEAYFPASPLKLFETVILTFARFLLVQIITRLVAGASAKFAPAFVFASISVWLSMSYKGDSGAVFASSLLAATAMLALAARLFETSLETHR